MRPQALTALPKGVVVGCAPEAREKATDSRASTDDRTSVRTSRSVHGEQLQCVRASTSETTTP